MPYCWMILFTVDFIKLKVLFEKTEVALRAKVRSISGMLAESEKNTSGF